MIGSFLIIFNLLSIRTYFHILFRFLTPYYQLEVSWKRDGWTDIRSLVSYDTL